MSEKKKIPNSRSGKGDKPRNCFSDDFKENYDLISWQEKAKTNKGGGRKFRKTY